MGFCTTQPIHSQEKPCRVDANVCKERTARVLEVALSTELIRVHLSNTFNPTISSAEMKGSHAAKLGSTHKHFGMSWHQNGALKTHNITWPQQIELPQN